MKSLLDHKKAIVAMASVGLVALSTVVALAAGAQTDPFASCSPENQVRFGEAGEFFGTETFSNRLANGGPESHTVDYSLPAGAYEVSAVASDAYSGRDDDTPQRNEQWSAQFLAADGATLAETSLTGDVPDSLGAAEWSGPIGEVSISEAVTRVRVVHAGIGDSANSVRAVCLSAREVAPHDATQDGNSPVDPQLAVDRILAACPAPNSIQFGTDSQFFGLGIYQNRLIAGNGPTSHTHDYELAAGTYNLSAVSIDGYTGRAVVPAQPAEQWIAEFLNASGAVIATSQATGDVEDGTELGSWSGPIGQVSVSEAVAQVRVVHAQPAGPNPNSVRAVCLSAALDVPPPADNPPADAPSPVDDEGTPPSDDDTPPPVDDEGTPPPADNPPADDEDPPPADMPDDDPVTPEPDLPTSTPADPTPGTPTFTG